MLPQEKPPNTLESQLVPLEGGTKKAKLSQLEPQEGKEDSASKNTKQRIKSPLSSMQESLPIPKKMTLSDKLNFYAQSTQKENWCKKLVQDSILNGENCSLYWNEYTKEISANLSLLTLTDSLGSDFRSLSGSVNKVNANSWFSMNVSYLQSKNSLKISCPSYTVSLLGFTDSENTKPKSKKAYKKRSRNQTKKLTPNSVRKIRVYPCKELYRIWKQWLAAYRWIYNWTIAKLKNGCTDSTYSLQSQARNSERPEWVKQLPGHQLQEAVADARDAYWQARKNGGDGSFKSCRAYSQVIKFKAGNYKKGTWYGKTTKKLPFVTKQVIPAECIYGTQLVYQKGKWYGCFPEHIPTEPTVENKVIALDPGSRAFVTGYDGEAVLEVGKKDIGRINRLCTHLDQLMSKISQSSSKRQRYKQRIAANRIREKIKNLVKDLHNKASSFLVNNYKVIFLPTFETSQMVRTRQARSPRPLDMSVLKQQRKIRSKTARNMLTWSHFRFAQHLTQMAARNNCIVVRCNESYTSKTCPECGTIHEKLGSSKVFKCPHCGYKAERDAHGARNIMIRALQATAITFSSDAIHLISSL